MLRGSKAVKRLRAFAFISIVSGLSLASLYASHREPSLLRIGDLKPIMNYSTVRVQGILESEARALRDGAVLYLIADESGSLPVFLNRALEGKPPRVGTRVSATGGCTTAPAG